jgi:hypothetical protein
MSLSLRCQCTVIALVFFWAYSASAKPASGKPSLRSGKVISAALNAHGSNAENNGFSHGRDIWWNYIISSGDQLYSVDSRDNPSKTGLAVNASIHFYEAKNWMYIPQNNGKPLILKIHSKSKIRKR